MSNFLQPHGLQHARPPCPSPTLRVYSNSCPLSQWYYLTISSSIASFSSHFQSFPASRSFLVSQFFASRGQSIGISASASVLPMNSQNWFPLGWTDWFFFLSKGLSRVFSNTTTNIQYQQLQVNQRPSSKGRIYFSCAWNWEWALFLLSWTDAIEVKLCNIQCYVIKSNMTFPAPPW